jgi:hypothetical protein
MSGPAIDNPGRVSRLLSEPLPQVNFLASLSGAARSADNLLSLAHQQLKAKAGNLRDEWEQEATKIHAKLTETLLVSSNTTSFAAVDRPSPVDDQGQQGRGHARNGVKRSFSTSALRRGQRSNRETDSGEVYAALSKLQLGAWSKAETPQNFLFGASPSLREQVMGCKEHRLYQVIWGCSEHLSKQA